MVPLTRTDRLRHIASHDLRRCWRIESFSGFSACSLILICGQVASCYLLRRSNISKQRKTCFRSSWRNMLEVKTLDAAWPVKTESEHISIQTFGLSLRCLTRCPHQHFATDQVSYFYMKDSCNTKTSPRRQANLGYHKSLGKAPIARLPLPPLAQPTCQRGLALPPLS